MIKLDTAIQREEKNPKTRHKKIISQQLDINKGYINTTTTTKKVTRKQQESTIIHH